MNSSIYNISFIYIYNVVPNPKPVHQYITPAIQTTAKKPQHIIPTCAQNTKSKSKPQITIANEQMREKKTKHIYYYIYTFGRSRMWIILSSYLVATLYLYYIYIAKVFTQDVEKILESRYGWYVFIFKNA